MPDTKGLKELIDNAVKLAEVAATVLPGAGFVAAGGRIAGQIITVIDSLTAKAAPADQTRLQAARKTLREAVEAKADRTSARLRG